MSVCDFAGQLDIEHARDLVAAKRPPQPESRTAAVSLLGVAFDPVNLTEALKRIEEMVTSGEPHYVVTANVDFLVQSMKDAELRRALLDASLVLCDSTPLLWASRLLNEPLPERVAGSDLTPHLLGLAAARGYRLFFLGASDEASAVAAERVRQQYPGIQIVGRYSPPFRPLTQMDDADIESRIRAAQPDLLLIAFGCPKAEKWMAKNYRNLGVPVCIGVGGTIDFLAGRMKRAPVWMRGAGLEWFYRLLQEPRRLWRRYARDLSCFGWALAKQRWHLPAGKAASDHAGGTYNQSQFDFANPQMTPGAAPNGSWHQIRLVGKLDATSFDSGKLIESLQHANGCLLDLTAVNYLDSAGVGHLLNLRREVLNAGRRLVVIAPDGPVRKALEWLRLGDFVEMAADREELQLEIAA